MGLSQTYQLKDFATVMRGIATGANEFFFLTQEQAQGLGIPTEYLKLAVGRTQDVLGSSLTTKNIEELERKRPPQLFYSLSPVTPKLARQFKTI